MSFPRFVTRSVSGWGRRPVEECDVYRPEGLEPLREVVANAPQQSLTPRGMGRSYGDASLNGSGALIASDRFDRMLSFDPDAGVLHCQSAVSLAEIIEHFLPRGFFFPVTPGTKMISIGGAIAADVHGKNHHSSGSMAAWLKEFRLLRADGEIIVCSRDQNPDAFWATVGGMGLTGVILDARLQLKPVETAYMSADYDHTPDVDSLLDRMAETEARFDYAVAWIDCQSRGRSLGRGVLLCANHARFDELPVKLRSTPFAAPSKLTVGLPFTLPNFALNPLSNRIFNEGYYRSHGRKTFFPHCNTYFYPLDAIQNWNRGYGSRGVLQYQAVLPEATAREGLIELLELITSSRTLTFLPILKSLGRSSDGLLSFPLQGKTLAIDLPYTGPEVDETVARMDAVVLRHGGRVYLAKDSRLAAESFAEMYPKLAQFREVRDKLDPNRRFSSSQARRLEILGSP